MQLLDRFLTYVAYPTMSNEDADENTCPSSEKQLALARHLAEELLSLGLTDAHTDENGYVMATLPANAEGYPRTVGFIAHMDTSSEAADAPIKPALIDYRGGDILLNAERGITMRTADYPYLENYRGKRLIVTDGTTLLGADDKAGVSEIVTAVERLIASGAPHGTIKIGFTPDEEIGRGADRFDVAAFGADYAYTVDGGTLGELEYENFNAASAKVVVHGISIHPGSAKGRMKNAALIACEFNALLPAHEIPAETEGYEGFHHLTGMQGGIESATLSYIIRDHDKAAFEEKKEQFRRAADVLNARYGEGTVELILRDSYYNMKEMIEPHMEIIDLAKEAMTACGVTPKTVPIRGGTDGARLSFMGLPCPNLCTGGENFHSRFEFACLDDMEKVTDILLWLMQKSGKI